LETNPATLTLRIGGLSEALPARLERLLAFLGNPPEGHTQVLEGEQEEEYWRWVSRLEWGLGYLVKVPLQPKKIPALETKLGPGMRRYLSAGNLLYMVWLDQIGKLDALLKSQGLSGLVLRSNLGGFIQDTLESPLIGVDLSQTFGNRVMSALDPSRRFSPEPGTRTPEP
jgi:glycolate oxidase FAD binding subunit